MVMMCAISAPAFAGGKWGHRVWHGNGGAPIPFFFPIPLPPLPAFVTPAPHRYYRSEHSYYRPGSAVFVPAPAPPVIIYDRDERRDYRRNYRNEVVDEVADKAYSDGQAMKRDDDYVRQCVRNGYDIAELYDNNYKLGKRDKEDELRREENEQRLEREEVRRDFRQGRWED